MKPNNLEFKKLKQYNSSTRNYAEATATEKNDDAKSQEHGEYMPEDIQIEEQQPEVHFYPTMNQTTPAHSNNSRKLSISNFENTVALDGVSQTLNFDGHLK